MVLFLTLAGLISNTVALISSTVAGLYVVSIVRRCGQLLGCGQTVVVLFLTLDGLISNTVALISSTVAGLYVVKKKHCSCCLFLRKKCAIYFEGCGTQIKGCGMFGTHSLWDDR